jgi:carnitine 3-dehydrogenase
MYIFAYHNAIADRILFFRTVMTLTDQFANVGMASRDRRVAIIGCGLIGESWAALFLVHSYHVDAWDPDPAVRERFAERIKRPLVHLGELGANLRVQGSLSVHDSLAKAVAQVGLVQENAPENIPLKRALYAEIEGAAPSDAIIASSTSALTWTDLSPDMRQPGRLVTAHPFNPPHLIPLVELFGTDADTVARAESIYRALGREPVRLKKDAVGHIANRLSSALWREAVHIVAAGIADVATVDAALVNGPGLRWSAIGAHMAYHLGGGDGGMTHYLSHLGPSQQRRWETLGTPKLTPEVCDMLIDGIAEEAAGRSVAQIEVERDAFLIRALKARRSTDAA